MISEKSITRGARFCTKNLNKQGIHNKAYPVSKKKSGLIILNILGRIWAEALANKFGLLQIHLEVFPALKMTQNCYKNMNISFFLKTDNLIINWSLSFFYNHTVPERLSHNLTKYKIKGTSKSQFLNFLVNWENLEVQSKLIFKKPNFPSFSWIWKSWEVQLEQYSKIKKSLCELGKTWKYSLSPTFKKKQFWIYRWIGKI